MRSPIVVHDPSRRRTGSRLWQDHLEAAHVGAERLGHAHGAVFPLVVLKDGDECAADGEARAVERVAEARLQRLALVVQAGGSVAQPHAARLEVAAVGARRDLAELLLAGQPHLDIIAHARLSVGNISRPRPRSFAGRVGHWWGIGGAGALAPAQQGASLDSLFWTLGSVPRSRYRPSRAAPCGRGARASGAPSLRPP